LLRDRDRIYGEPFPATAHSMRIHEVLTAPHSLWQNPYCERLIGSIRRECLDRDFATAMLLGCGLRRHCDQEDGGATVGLANLFSSIGMDCCICSI
jgi:hypothetical protein